VREGRYDKKGEGLEGGGQIECYIYIINVGGEGNHTLDIYP